MNNHQSHPETLDEREFELVNIIGAALAKNQRDLSKQMNMSLGMTNMLLRRLVTKGYIRITQLNKRKVQYLLTPKGFSEKMRKSVKYTIKTIDSIGRIKKGLADLINQPALLSNRLWCILGGDDLGGLIEYMVKEQHLSAIKIKRITDIEEAPQDALILNCKEKSISRQVDGRSIINVVEWLAHHDHDDHHVLSKSSRGES